MQFLWNSALWWKESETLKFNMNYQHVIKPKQPTLVSETFYSG